MKQPELRINGTQVFRIYLAYLSIYDIPFKSTSLCRPQGGKELPLLAFSDTIKYYLLQLFLHIFYGLASIYNLHQANERETKKKKKKSERKGLACSSNSCMETTMH